MRRQLSTEPVSVPFAFGLEKVKFDAALTVFVERVLRSRMRTEFTCSSRVRRCIAAKS